jgi:hypothetical protein
MELAGLPLAPLFGQSYHLSDHREKWFRAWKELPTLVLKDTSIERPPNTDPEEHRECMSDVATKIKM